VRRAWYIATKELLQNRRDALAALFTLVLPVIFTVVLGLLIGSEQGDRLPLALADTDASPAARRFVDRLESSPLLEVEEMTAAQIEDAVHDQKAAGGLIIPAGFGAAVETGGSVSLTFVRVETSTAARSVWQEIESAVSDLNTATLAARVAAEQAGAATGSAADAPLLASARTLAEDQLATPAITLETIDSGTATESQARGFDQSSTGSLVNWVLFSLLGIAATMVWERHKGLLRRLNVIGVTAREIVGGKMTAMVILTFLQQLFLVLLGRFAFGVGYFNSPLALLLTMVSLSMFAATFGLLISVLFRTEQAVIGTTVIAAQALAALGGAWFPLEITGAGFSKAAHFLPTAWVMDSLHGIILKDWGIRDVLLPMGVVWIWIIALFALAIWRYRPD